MTYLTVVIPVRNEAEHIAYTLDRLLAQNFDSDKLDIIVVDGLSEDQTPQIVQEYVEKHPNIVRYFVNTKKLASAARNIGVQNARGEAVLIVDGHCIIDNNDMLRNVSDAFERTGADCLGRPQPLEMTNATSLQWAIAAARRSPLGHHPDSFIYSGEAQFSPASSVAVAYRKSVFEKVGIFDENFDAAEDVEFNTRCDAAGLKCYFEPAIAVRYVPRSTLKALGDQMERYGRGRVRLWRKHRHTFSWKSFAPGVFTFGFYYIAFCVVLAFIFQIAAVVLGITSSMVDATLILVGCTLMPFLITYGLLYVPAVILESARLSFKQKRRNILPFLPFVFYIVHFAYGDGVLSEFFFPRRLISHATLDGKK